MRQLSLPLKTLRLRNFKAVRDSRAVRFTPLTVFIGNNGSGKSSLVEGLETFQAIVEEGLDKAMQQWRGFEYVWNRAFDPASPDPMSFALTGRTGAFPFSAKMSVYAENGASRIYILHEHLSIPGLEGLTVERDSKGHLAVTSASREDLSIRAPGRSSFSGVPIENFIDDWRFAKEWQFLSLVPQGMGAPVPQSRAAGKIKLAKDGSNIAEYLLSIRQQDQAAFGGILESLRYVLPYAEDVQPAVTSELERAVYLQMTEGQSKVPGWLLSTGTLRIVAILALLRHPDPPPLIFIEEIENGLDPRTIHLLVREIQEAVESGRTQVVCTTHSPYLLDLLPLSSIVLAERVDGEPAFTRPADDRELRKWAGEFSPGQLYTMSRLGQARNGR